MALLKAVREGSIDEAKRLIDEGEDVNQEFKSHYYPQYDCTLLYEAIDNARSEAAKWPMVELLLDSGAEVNHQGLHYGNALQRAAVSGSKVIVQLLLDRGADVNAQGGRYGNALQAAAAEGHEVVVRLLLDRGADVNAQGGIDGNALRAAAAGGHEVVVRLLLDRGADVNAQGRRYGNALQASIAGGKKAAAAGGHEVVVRLLLDRGADVNQQGGYYGNALQAAAYGVSETIVRLLLDRGADVNQQGGYYGNALQAAACREWETIVRSLLDRGADVNQQGGYYGNALQAAACRKSETIIRLLLDRGADVNQQGGYFGNALQAASASARRSFDERQPEKGRAIVQLLLDRGAEVNAQGGRYGSALFAATEHGRVAVAELLLERGADVGRSDKRYRYDAVLKNVPKDATRRSIVKKADKLWPQRDNPWYEPRRTELRRVVEVNNQIASDAEEYRKEVSQPSDQVTDVDHSNVESARASMPVSIPEKISIRYKYSSTRRIIPAIQDAYKKSFEYAVGSQLSWWPLSNPEDEVEADFIRVYSMPFRRGRFFDDIPITLAESLFAGLAELRAQKRTWNFLQREAICLEDTILSRLLDERHTSRHGELLAEGQNRTAANPSNEANAPGNTNTRSSIQTRSKTGTTFQNARYAGSGGSKAGQSSERMAKIDGKAQNTPILFLSMSAGPYKSVAQMVEQAANDKATFQNLREAYRSVSIGRSWTMKKVVGVKFYRFRSFLYKPESGVHYVTLHKDKERYPSESDPEHDDYCFAPQPWPSDEPYPSGEACYFFMYPDECGTSGGTTGRLPVRSKGLIKHSDARAWGMHVEERFSGLLLFVPAAVLILVTLGTTLWFVPIWLEQHPDDLQNATVPVVVAFTVIATLVQLVITLVMFRWTVSGVP